MSTPRVIWHDSVIPAEVAPGIMVSRIVTQETGATQLSSGITTFAPGTSNGTHFHNAEESVTVIAGEGILVLQGQEHHLKPYDAAFITPGAHHRFISKGDVPFKILWAYATTQLSAVFVEEGG